MNKRNCSLFIISYFVSNIMSGLLYDTYINYLQEVSISVATSFWAFYGYATLLSAVIMLLVPYIGYKKLLLLCNSLTSIALLLTIFFSSQWIYLIATLIALTGVQLHYSLLAPFISIYTTKDDKIDWYTKAWYIGYIGYFLATYLGGLVTVKLFSIIGKIDYSQAKQLTAFVDTLSSIERTWYISAHQKTLLIVGILGIVSAIPLLLLKENKNDYQQENNRFNLSIYRQLINKDALIYLAYWALISFGMGLFTSYITVFLNRNLHIDKATSSLLVSLSYLAITIFMLFTPIIVKKIGQVATLGTVFVFSIPFMILIAEANRFSNYKIMIVGVALFMRAGLANLGSPVDSSLSMDLVPTTLRPAYASLISFVSSIASIISGHFTGSFLFKNQEGYRHAYYIAAIIYLVAAIILIVGLWKYNTIEKSDCDSELKGL